MLILEYLQANPAIFVACVGVLGLIIGSFLNVVIYRLPVIMDREALEACSEILDCPEKGPAPLEEPFNLITPRSRCPKCDHGITALENIPVVSWLFLRGRCSACGVNISIRYPAIEALTGVLSAVVAWHFGFGWQALAALAFTWVLISLCFIDFDHQLLPDSITLPFLWVGLLSSLFGLHSNLESAVIGAVAGYLALWLLYQGYKQVTDKEGMGYGDFKLLAMVGAWLGWQNLPATIFIAAVLGATVGLSLIFFRSHNKDIPIPFGPYLAGAGWIAMLWGSDLTRWYLS